MLIWRQEKKLFNSFHFFHRYLNPANFNKEIVLEFNFGPQHLLEGLVEEVYTRRPREFVFKSNEQGELVSMGMLVDQNHGLAIRTFREKQLKSSKFPSEFWN